LGRPITASVGAKTNSLGTNRNRATQNVLAFGRSGYARGPLTGSRDRSAPADSRSASNLPAFRGIGRDRMSKGRQGGARTQGIVAIKFFYRTGRAGRDDWCVIWSRQQRRGPGRGIRAKYGRRCWPDLRRDRRIHPALSRGLQLMAGRCGERGRQRPGGRGRLAPLCRRGITQGPSKPGLSGDMRVEGSDQGWTVMADCHRGGCCCESQ